MKNKRIKWLICGAVMLSYSLSAQITERERPAEWNRLVPGGRFVDRFEAMPEGRLSDKVWGTDSVRPRFVDNGIESPEISFWGGNILQTLPGGNRQLPGRYHLFVCGWPENAPKGHMEWPNSTVYHAVSNRLSGPYTIQDTIGKGHNPEAYRLDDGRIIVYVIDGYYIADDVNGPWKYGKFTFEPRDRRIIEGLSNLTFARRQDGSYLMVCRGGGIWISRDGLASYRQITEKRIYPEVDGEFEDPVVWRDSLQYHLIVNDWLGRIAYYQRSKDGVHWITEPGEAYVPGISFHTDGRVEHWFKYERAKVFQDAEGRVEQMNFAVIDTIKWNDLGNDNHSFGGGGKALESQADGRDLIVTFDGTASGITEEEFAPKLLGRDKKGKLLFGYASLPYVDYKPAILSGLRPVYHSEKNELTIEIENFGLSASKTTLVLPLQSGTWQEKEECEIAFVHKGKVQGINTFEKVNE